MPSIGPFELIIILVIALVIIGPGRLPDVGAALGKSIREFRKASSDLTEATRVDTAPQPATTSTPTPGSNTTPPPADTPLPPSAAPAPTPQPSTVAPTAPAVPAPIQTPPTPSDDEPTNLPS